MPPECTEVRLHVLSRDEVELFNALYTGCSALSLGFEDDRLRVSFLPVHRHPYRSEMISTIEVGGAALEIGFDQLFFSDRIQELTGGNDLTRYPDEVRAAVFEAALESLLDRFEAWSGHTADIPGIEMAPAESEVPASLFFELRRASNPAVIRGHLQVNESGTALLKEMIEKLPPAAGREWDDLPIRVWFEMGSARLSVRELASIEPRDIVLPDECALQNRNRVRIRWAPDRRLNGVLQDRTITVTESECEYEEGLEAMNEETLNHEDESAEDEPAAETEKAASVDDLPVELVFELGEQRMPLSALKRLQPGYVFNLEKTLEKPVTVRANGRIIGYGELVQIEDRIGVRVLELFEHDA